MNNTTTIQIDPYSSKTGTGTLSYYARKYGTTTSELMKLNPSIINPDIIQSGANLIVPTTTQPSVVTSTPAADAVKRATDYINSQTNTGTYINNNQGNTNSTTTTSNISPYEKQINDSYVSEITGINDQRAKLMAGTSDLDVALKNKIDYITNKYENRIREQQDLNKRYLAATETIGYSSGRARYAPQMQQDILTREEKDGMQRISDLEDERQSLISEAQAAKDENQFKLLNDLENRLTEINKEKRQAVNDQFDRVYKTEQLAIDRAKESRASIKEEMANFSSAYVPSIVEQIDLNPTDSENIIKQYSTYTGFDADTIKSLVSQYRQEIAKSNPSDIREYEYYKKQSGYTGNLMDYMRLKKTATSISSGSGNEVLTRQDATNFQLPEELIGQSKKDIITQLKVSKVPDWFKKSQIASGWIQEGASDEEFQSQWNAFRGTTDMKVLLDQIDINKAGKDNISTSDDLQTLLNAINQ